MKKLFTLLCILSLTITAFAQEETTRLTLFKTFGPAKIQLTSGKTINNQFTNIALKDAALLYLQGSYTMQAKMETIKGVEIKGRHFVNIKGQLAECLDTIGNNRLFDVTLVDIPAFQQMLKNNRNITSLDLSSDVTSYTTIDLEAEDDRRLPMIHIFYYLYNGKLIKTHEREVWRVLPKAKRHIYKSIISLPDFKWVDRQSLVKLLNAISEKESANKSNDPE